MIYNSGIHDVDDVVLMVMMICDDDNQNDTDNYEDLW